MMFANLIFSQLGMPPLRDELVFVKLCAGSGILSKTFQEHGFLAVRVDYDGNKDRAFTQVYSIDLAGQGMHRARVVAWYMDLPCGTCSRARKIPISPPTPDHFKKH
jgi:hypothetical protein